MESRNSKRVIRSVFVVVGLAVLGAAGATAAVLAAPRSAATAARPIVTVARGGSRPTTAGATHDEAPSPPAPAGFMTLAPRNPACEGGAPDACAVAGAVDFLIGDESGADHRFSDACDDGSPVACWALANLERDREWPTPEIGEAARRLAFLGVERDENGIPRPTDRERFAHRVCLAGVGRVCVSLALAAERDRETGRALRDYALACRAGYPLGCAAAAVLSIEAHSASTGRSFAGSGCADGSNVACALAAVLAEDPPTITALRESFGRRCAADTTLACDRLPPLARFAGLERVASAAR